MYSFKINSHVSFPLEGLDLKPFLAKESSSQITTYDLLSVICHHGTAGSKLLLCNIAKCSRGFEIFIWPDICLLLAFFPDEKKFTALFE